MSNELVQSNYTPDQIHIIKTQIAEGCTDLELALFLQVCKKTQLDPFTRQIYTTIRKSKNENGDLVKKMLIQTSIDGQRLIADRSGEYEGQVGPFWCGEDGVWKDVWLSQSYPAAAKVGVWKKGFREPIYAIAHFNEYAQTKTGGGYTLMWSQKPKVMLAKCAEALALRKAFPNHLSGLYTPEEVSKKEEDELTLNNKIECHKISDFKIGPIHENLMEIIFNSIGRDFSKIDSICLQLYNKNFHDLSKEEYENFLKRLEKERDKINGMAQSKIAMENVK